MTPLASKSVPEHLVRGAIGLLAVILAIVGTAAWSPIALLGFLVAIAAWRGCPTCWSIGLMQTKQACALKRPD